MMHGQKNINKGVVFGGDGIKYEGGSYGLTVLHCMLQF